MATTHIWPVLIWRDSMDGVTAALLGDYEDGVAYGANERDALDNLEALLAWRAVHQPWTVEPDLEEVAIVEVKLDVRLQYKADKRLLPCPEVVVIRVPCVTGKTGSGAMVCEVPHFGLRFSLQEIAGVRDLVRHYVTEKLQGLTPLGLAGCLPPTGCELREVKVRVEGGKTKRVAVLERADLKELVSVADPLLEDRGRLSAAYGRDSLCNALCSKLVRERANILLVGEPGVGKSTVMLDAARRVLRNATPDADDAGLSRFRFWRCAAARIIAGMRYLGEWEERCEAVVAQVSKLNGVLCFENLLDLVRVGGRDASDSVAAFLLPYLQRGELRLVAEATPAGLEACRRLMPGLLDVFQVFHVPMMEGGEALDVLRRIFASASAPARIDVEPAVPSLVQRLFRRFMPYAAFPGPTAGFARRLCDDAARQPANEAGRRAISEAEAISAFVKQTGLPERLLRDEIAWPLEEIRKELGAEIIGQPEPVETAARVLATLKSGLNDPQRPCGVLLFCGPTGVGKTALARTLSNVCFGAGGEQSRLVRLDMSEFTGPYAAWRLLQSTNGGPAEWLTQIRRQPFCVVLFDEIEKADAAVFDILLGLLDEGRLSDRFGRTTDFRSAIILLTSNLGTTLRAGMGFGGEQGSDNDGAVRKFFRPEFFNRLDAVVNFQPLSEASVRDIAEKELRDLSRREGLEGLRLTWSAGVVDLLVKEGYDRSLGARPLQRAMEQYVVTPLARWLSAKPGAAGELRLRIAGGRVVVE